MEEQLFEAIKYIVDSEIEKAFTMSGMSVTNEEIKKILTASDDMNKQSLYYSEFIIVCLNLKKLITREKVEGAFNYFDIDNSGAIEALDIKNALLRFGKRILNEDDVYKMIREVTKKPNKKDISFDEFVSIFPCCFDNKN